MLLFKYKDWYVTTHFYKYHNVWLQSPILSSNRHVWSRLTIQVTTYTLALKLFKLRFQLSIKRPIKKHNDIPIEHNVIKWSKIK